MEPLFAKVGSPRTYRDFTAAVERAVGNGTFARRCWPRLSDETRNSLESADATLRTMREGTPDFAIAAGDLLQRFIRAKNSL